MRSFESITITAAVERAEEMAVLLRDAIHGSKVVRTSLDMEIGEDAAIDSIYQKMAARIGRLAPMEENLSDGEKTGDLFTDIVYDPRFPNSYRHSYTRQPLHTDGAYEAAPPDISFFYCLAAAEHGGATTFIDSRDLKELMARFEPALLERLLRTAISFGKASDGKASAVIREVRGDFHLCWNFFRAVSCPDDALIADFHRFLEERLAPSGILREVALSRGDAVFFRDELVLHGRNSFFGHRHLRKGGIYLPDENR